MDLSGEGKKKWADELQALSGIAILFVVIVHINCIYTILVLNKPNCLHAPFLIEIIDDIAHCAVPIFIFITGFKYELNDRIISFREYILKKLDRVVLPFIILSSLFVYRDFVLNSRSFSLSYLILKVSNELTGKNIAYHLWYIPMFVFVVATYPLIYKYLRDVRVRSSIIFLLVFGQAIVGNIIPKYNARPYTFLYYYMFFEMGVLACKYDLKSKVKRFDLSIILINLVLCVILTIIPNDKIEGLISDYFVIPISVIANYLLSVRIKENLSFKFLGRYSFYIYLLHAPLINNYITDGLYKFGILNPVIFIVTSLVLNLSITVLFYKILDKTRLNKILFYSFRGRQKLYNYSQESYINA